MKRADSQHAWERLAGAEQRARSRRIERHRMQRKTASESRSERDAHLAQLRALYDVLATGHFSEQEIFEADAGLKSAPDTRQKALALPSGGGHAA